MQIAMVLGNTVIDAPLIRYLLWQGRPIGAIISPYCSSATLCYLLKYNTNALGLNNNLITIEDNTSEDGTINIEGNETLFYTSLEEAEQTLGYYDVVVNTDSQYFVTKESGNNKILNFGAKKVVNCSCSKYLSDASYILNGSEVISSSSGSNDIYCTLPSDYVVSTTFIQNVNKDFTIKQVYNTFYVNSESGFMDKGGLYSVKQVAASRSANNIVDMYHLDGIDKVIGIAIPSLNGRVYRRFYSLPVQKCGMMRSVFHLGESQLTIEGFNASVKAASSSYGIYYMEDETMTPMDAAHSELILFESSRTVAQVTNNDVVVKCYLFYDPVLVQLRQVDEALHSI